MEEWFNSSIGTHNNREVKFYEITPHGQETIDHFREIWTNLLKIDLWNQFFIDVAPRVTSREVGSYNLVTIFQKILNNC